MGLHYIYVNSQDKKKEEAICDFTINLHNPINSVKRVGISSFTSSNNSYNVTKKNNRVRWLEQKESVKEEVVEKKVEVKEKKVEIKEKEEVKEEVKEKEVYASAKEVKIKEEVKTYKYIKDDNGFLFLV